MLVVDESSKDVIDNTVKEDDILNQNIASTVRSARHNPVDPANELIDIERIEERREPNPTMDAIYILSPKPHIVDCLMADFERRRYRKAFLVWLAPLDRPLEDRLQVARQQIGGMACTRVTSPNLYLPRLSLHSPGLPRL